MHYDWEYLQAAMSRHHYDGGDKSALLLAAAENLQHPDWGGNRLLHPDGRPMTAQEVVQHWLDTDEQGVRGWLNPPHAVFVLALCAQHRGRYAGTTRADGSRGLPGGKVDAGERPEQAAIRESREEGWEILLTSRRPIHRQTVDGREVWWFGGTALRMVPVRPEDKRRGIRPIPLTGAEIRETGMGNDRLDVV